MTNKEFFRLSETEVHRLNGSMSDDAQEAWRSGYIYAQNKIKKSLENDDQADFFETCENFVNDELEIFDSI